MRIALLSNVTDAIVAEMLRAKHEVWTAPGFGGWMETALEPPETLRTFSPDAIFLVLDPGGGRAPEKARVDAAKAALGAVFPLAATAAVDIEDLFCSLPPGVNPYDGRMWELAKMPWSLAGARAVSGEIDRLCGFLKGGEKKVLAVDFDGTLWNGIAGEDGPGGVSPRKAFQKKLKEFVSRGILLAGVSANNKEDVEPLLDDPRSILRREDFAALRVDWNPKPQNIESIAVELNLGIDSFVFIDDNPAERARMKAELPEVAVPDFPAEAAKGGGESDAAMTRFARRIERMYFPGMARTADDANRMKMYSEEAKRKRAAAGLDMEEWLRSLEMEIDVHEAREEEFARIAQLSQKSNQFNVLTERRTAAAVAAAAADPAQLLVAAHVSDRFGDMGLVAFVSAATTPGGEASIEDWTMSCRAMNRRVEYEIEKRFETLLAARGVRVLRAKWRRTRKNAPVENLFENLGFETVSRGEDEKEYVKRLAAT